MEASLPPGPAWLVALPIALRVLVILGMAALLHLAVRAAQELPVRVLTPAGQSGPRAREAFARAYPKLATLTSLAVSTLTFLIYFVAVGVALRHMNVDPTAYFATATVVGLAIGFGSQGLVQDVVIGLTLLFSDAFDIGDTIEVAGQIGRVERIGLRFTTLVNFLGQTVYIPNRNIAQVGRYRGGVIRAYVDAQVPDTLSDDEVLALMERLAKGFRTQHRSIVLTEPLPQGVRAAEEGGWRYARLMFRLWPGQGALVETVFRPRLLAALRAVDPQYADWMVVITYRVLRE
ncbi:MAG TPA: mechanosensitive ion channel domain-containing protein [Longimicrobiales bacterium]|nr:mechanosensitive ion channel domain-containing protein [Longimicrobiales bacterium]